MPANEDWLDTGEAKAVVAAPPAIPAEFVARHALVEECWGRLSPAQRTFLAAWRECRFNARAANRAVHGVSYTNTSHTKWSQEPDYSTVMRVWRAMAADSALDKDRLLTRQDDIVETLLTPKPVLHQGVMVPDTRIGARAGDVLEEVEAGAASRANEVLMKAAGLLKDKELEVNIGLIGPSLNIQVVQPNGEVKNVTPRGVTVEMPEPTADGWLDGP
jgi:hypothetical protein